MDRRRFLTLLASIFGLSALIALFYPLLRLLTPLESESKKKSTIIPNSEVPVGTAKDIVIGGTPAIVINRKDKGYTILSRVCTHLGCLVKYDKEKQSLICPCHAGIFDLEGNVLSGPPPKPLQRFPFRVEGDNVVIG